MVTDLVPVVIVGPEGCGSTAFNASLSRVKGACVVGDLTYSEDLFGSAGQALLEVISQPDKDKADGLSSVSRAMLQLWHAERVIGDRQADVSRYSLAREKFSDAYRTLLDHAQSQRSDLTHVITKFSQPYSAEGLPSDHLLASYPEYLPAPYDERLLDVLSLPWPFETHRLVVLRRDPRECAYSQLRRNFYKNIRVAARWTELGLNHLCAQIRARGKPFFVLDFAAIDRHDELAEHLGEFLGMDVSSLSSAFAAAGLRPRGGEPGWKTQLDTADRSFLDDFFGPTRMKQWNVLFSPPSHRASEID